MESIHIREGLMLEPLHHGQAAELTALVEANRAHLKPWMPWAHHMETITQFEGYIEKCIQAWEADQEYGYCIFEEGKMVGRITIHQVNRKNDICELGYWLAAEAQGRGIVTSAARVLTAKAFNEMGFHRVEIKCAVDNQKSSAVPKRLGYTLEGVLAQAEKYHAGYRDLELYALVKTAYLR